MHGGKTLLSNGQCSGEEDTDIKGVSAYKSAMTHSTAISNKGCEKKGQVFLGSSGGGYTCLLHVKSDLTFSTAKGEGGNDWVRVGAPS